MKRSWKHILSALVLAVFVVVFYGGALLLAVLFAAFTLPPYAQYALWAWAAVTLPLAVVALAGRSWLPQRAKRWMGFGTLGVLVLCLAWCGFGAWRAAIPTVDDDRTGLLREYAPFDEDTKAVRLDGPADLQLSPMEAWNLTLDGATALYPVYSAFVQAVYPDTAEGIYDPQALHEIVQCSGTVAAYERLLDGTSDIAFAAAPSQAQLDAAAAAGMEYHLTPIGREAFVFFVNSRNPVTELTVAEIQGIYTGEITNWAEVGGKKQSIRPFQRAENSGSQSALERLKEGLPLMEPEMEDRLASMGGIIREVASYRNFRNAIGFSFRFYATEMVENGDIRLLALDGVEPTREAIREGTYPITETFYAVTAAPVGEPAREERDQTVAAFLDWILSDQGQRLIEETGYVEELQKEETDEAEARIENIDELLSKMVTYSESEEFPTLGGFLEEVALIADIDSLEEGSDYVVLMTLHSAKGLEFPNVYMTGMEDGLFPSYMTITADDPMEIEEERRLCYVGITRAKEHLTLTSARMRMTRGETQYHKISRFVKEIPSDLLQGAVRSERIPEEPFQESFAGAKRNFDRRPYGGAYGQKEESMAAPFGKSFDRDTVFDLQKPSKPKNSPYSQANPYAKAAKSFGNAGDLASLNYGEGDRVKHSKFGEGTVIRIVSGGRDYEVTVEFDQFGVKKMFASFAKLQKLC